MEKDLETLYLSEIQSQCAIGVFAYGALIGALKAHAGTTVIWHELQSILIAAANVSKILWPRRAASKARGEHLRALLEVADSSPLADRTVRNDFEHYDERLEDRAESLSGGLNLVDNSVGPRWGFGKDNTLYLRYFNTTDFEVQFAENTVQIHALAAAMRELAERISAKH